MKTETRKMTKTRAALRKNKEEGEEYSEEQEGEGGETGSFRKEQRISKRVITENLSLTHIYMNLKSITQHYKEHRSY